MKAIVTFQFRHLDLKVIGRIATLLTGLVLVIPGCTPEMAEDADANGFSAPSEITRRIT